MLVVVQFPFADARPFIHETHRLRSPTWPIPKVGKHFVRGFGVVRKRGRGSVPEWPGERVYCRAASALRFEDGDRGPRLGPSKTRIAFDCVFRRLLSDGLAVCRIEVGFRSEEGSKQDCSELLRGCMDFPVRVRSPEGRWIPTRLGSAAQFLAQYYLYATTRLSNGQPQNTDPWWLTPGDPLIVVEFEPGEIDEPEEVRRVKHMPHGVRLSHWHCERVGMWLLRTRWWLGGDDDVRRRLRIHLCRLHAERESLKAILRLTLLKKIEIERGTEPSETLQRYLVHSQRLLSRRWRHGLSQCDILQAAYLSDELVAAGERADLLAALSGVRNDVRCKVSDLMAARPVRVVNIVSRRTTVTDKQINIQNSRIEGNVVAADAITNSFNRIDQSTVPDTLKDALRDLAKAVSDMLRALPADKAEQAGRDLEMLTSEAISPAPRRKWYELSADGLIEAAKTVAEIGRPVIEAVKLVAGLLD